MTSSGSRSGRGSRSLWVFGGISVVFITAVVVVAIVVTRGGGEHSAGTSAAGHSAQSGKADITHITDAMLVEQSSFPPLYPPSWKASARGEPEPAQTQPAAQVEPAQCSAIVAPPSNRWARAQGTLLDGTRIVVFLAPTKDRLDWHRLVQQCTRITYDDGSAMTLKPLGPQGLPDWATAFEMSSSTQPADRSLLIRGTYRGVYIDAVCSYNRDSADRTADLVRVFDDQVGKLEAAP